MNELELLMIKLQSMVAKMYVQAHGYHWNIEGQDFKQYHEFLLEIYEDVYDSIDPISYLWTLYAKMRFVVPKSLAAADRLPLARTKA